jgi:hypothetical protein
VDETTVKRLLCCGVRRTGEVMGHVLSVLVEDMSRNNFFFAGSNIMYLRFISICDPFTDSPSYFKECL